MKTEARHQAELLAAAFFGVAVGMLVAPKTGAELRRLITHKSEDLIGDITDQLEQLKMLAGDKVPQVRRLLGGDEQTVEEEPIPEEQYGQVEDPQGPQAPPPQVRKGTLKERAAAAGLPVTDIPGKQPRPKRFNFGR